MVNLQKKTDVIKTPVSLQTYVNLNSGLLFKTEVHIPGQLHKLVGKSVKAEICEMNTVCVDGQYYDIIGHFGSLVHIAPILEV